MSAAPRSTRRDFLQGKSAADAAMTRVVAGEAPCELPTPTSEGYLLQFSRRAMACQVRDFSQCWPIPTRDTEAALAALDLVDRLEDQLSVFREHSEISRLNRLAADGPVPSSRDCSRCSTQAVRFIRDGQAPTTSRPAPLSRAWGFMRRARHRSPTPTTLAAAPRAASAANTWNSTAASHSVRFSQPGWKSI